MRRWEYGLPNLLCKRVALAVTVVVLLSFALTTGLLVHVARLQDARSVEQTAALAGAAFDRRFEIAAKNVKDYAAWGEAYQHLHTVTDVAWAFDRQNVGPTLYKDLGYDYVLVVGPADRVTYAVVGGRLATGAPSSLLTGGLDQLVARARGAEPGTTAPVTGLLYGDGIPLIAAAAAISPGGDTTIPLKPGVPSVLVFADALKADRLLEIGAPDFVHDFGIAQDGDLPDVQASFTRASADASRATTFRWTPDRPGHEILIMILPWLSVAGCGVALLAILIAQYFIRTARLIESKTRQLAEAYVRADHAAHHDSLTGLPNRPMLQRYLDDRLRHDGDGFQPSTILYLDLDGFKEINDALGHGAGDVILKATSARLRSVLCGSDIVARIGGDEFVLVKSGGFGSDDATRFCNYLIKLLTGPIDIDGSSVTIGVSIGVAMALVGGQDAETLLRLADGAMYRAKAAGGNIFKISSDDGPESLPTPMTNVPARRASAI